MINKIHQNMREALYQLAQTKKLILVDKSQNNILLVSSNIENFSSIEKFIKKEFILNGNYKDYEDWSLYTSMYKIKEMILNKDKVKYKVRIGLIEHLCGHNMVSLMVSVNI